MKYTIPVLIVAGLVGCATDRSSETAARSAQNDPFDPAHLTPTNGNGANEPGAAVGKGSNTSNQWQGTDPASPTYPQTGSTQSTYPGSATTGSTATHSTSPDTAATSPGTSTGTTGSASPATGSSSASNPTNSGAATGTATWGATGAGGARSNTDADNTRRNAAEHGDALTPGDQGTSETDRRLTQQIRKALIADDSLSVTAKNVKIITNNGRVTLKGAVKTEQERSSIEQAAKNAAGSAQVDNQLKVSNK